MARLARVIAAGVPHHITQRGNARRFILQEEAERKVYLDLLRHGMELWGVGLIGYCLMSNHIHLIAVPQGADRLARALQETHGRFASYWNALHHSTGHVWQGRYYSCPLDEPHLWEALRYPELNLTYWGTGSPSPWSTITRGTFGADSLYVDSTVALNPDTGKLVWYYQHVPHDPYDQDYAFERIIVPVTVRGERHKAVITVGKPGIFEALDAATGKFLFALDPGAQNDLTSVNPVTGARTTLSEPPPPGVKNCPTGMGVRSFPAGAYSPLTNLYYMPIDDYCMGKTGDTPSRFLALNVNTQKLVWDMRTRVPKSSVLWVWELP